jgi:hypothetical protein
MKELGLRSSWLPGGMLGVAHVYDEGGPGGSVRGTAVQQFVGIDLHRRRSVIVRTTAAGEV